MGYVTTIFIKPKKVSLLQSYNGRFVMDQDAHIISSTLPSGLPAPHIKAIADTVAGVFRSAFNAGLDLTACVVSYAGLELRITRARSSTHVFMKAKETTEE